MDGESQGVKFNFMKLMQLVVPFHDIIRIRRPAINGIYAEHGEIGSHNKRDDDIRMNILES